jgi:hypothetical protein
MIEGFRSRRIRIRIQSRIRIRVHTYELWIREAKNHVVRAMRNTVLILTCVADPGCLSAIQLFSIPDPNSLHPGSRIIIEFKYLNQKINKTMLFKLL